MDSMYAKYPMRPVLAGLSRARHETEYCHSVLESKGRFGIGFLPYIGIGHVMRRENCPDAELGHSDIPMPEYYRSDENAWTWSSFIFYTRSFF